MKQTYKIHNKETTVRVLNTQVSAVRKKDIQKKAVRVIENGFIGIAGGIGNIGEGTLEKKARDNLSIEIPYDYDLEPVKKESVHIDKCTLNQENLMERVEEIMAFFRENYPEFDFSEVAKLVESHVTFMDDRGTDLSYKDTYVEMGFLMKEKALSNLFDGFVGYHGRNYDHEKFIESSRMTLDAYKNKLEMPEEEVLPVIIMDQSIFHGKLMKELQGEKYGSGASLLTGKIGEKVFNERITICQDFNPETAYHPFFDVEGVVNEDFKYDLIKDGILKACYTDKRVSKEYDLAHTGSASGAYDDVPSLGGTNLSLEVDSSDLLNTVKKGIVIVIAAGGDYTSDGAYATPVQKAFLLEEGKIQGTLPEFQLKSHIFKMLGDDYMGTFESPFYFGDHDKVTVAKMKIVK